MTPFSGTVKRGQFLTYLLTNYSLRSYKGECCTTTYTSDTNSKNN